MFNFMYNTFSFLWRIHVVGMSVPSDHLLRKNKRTTR